jgi:hypothetical protein
LAVYESSSQGELEGRLSALAGRAGAGVYEVSPRPHRSLCLTCPGRRTLCSWSEEETLRERAPDGLGAQPQDAGGALRLF